MYSENLALQIDIADLVLHQHLLAAAHTWFGRQACFAFLFALKVKLGQGCKGFQGRLHCVWLGAIHSELQGL